MIECTLCNRRIDSTLAAIEAGWIPSFFYEGDDYETGTPACDKCADKMCVDDDGEMVYDDNRKQTTART